MEIVKFEPFSSLLHPTFWHKLTQLKLDVLQLDESAISITGEFSFDCKEGFPPQFIVDYTSFDENPNYSYGRFFGKGKLFNTNTIEAFQKLCCRETLTSEGNELFQFLNTNEALETPWKLNNSLILCYADLKKYHFNYWLAYPTISPSEPYVYEVLPKKLAETWEKTQYNAFTKSVTQFLTENSSPFFAFDSATSNCYSLKHIQNNQTLLSSVLFCFADPSSSANPGWPLRNYILLVQQHFGSKLNGSAKFVGVRRSKSNEGELHFRNSILCPVKVPATPLTRGMKQHLNPPQLSTIILFR